MNAPTEDSPELYAVLDRRVSGESQLIAEYVDPLIALAVANLLRSSGADARIELIERPIP